VWLVVSDLLLEKDSCQATITVTDVTPPQITSCPGNVTVSCQGNIPPVNTGAVVATDNCGFAVTHRGDVSDGLSCPETITRTYRATDVAGLFDECTQIITVDDTEAPQLVTCAADLQLQCPAGIPACNPADATFSDNCGPTDVACDRADNGGAGSVASPLIITDTYTATDDCGNAGTCVRTIMVVDDTPPAPQCPGNIVELVAPGSTEAVVTYVSSFTDNCAGGSVDCIPPSGSTFPLGVTTVTCTATDAMGNMDECSFLVTVTEILPNPPVAVDDHKSTRGGAILYVVGAGVLANDYDIDGDPMTAILNTDVAIGTLTLNPDGSFMFTAPADYVGPAEFTYFANDGIANSAAPATVFINVKPNKFLVGDFDEDGYLTALDLGAEIDALFAGGPNPRSLECRASCADFDCSGFPDITDLGKMIGHIFAGAAGPCDPCDH
jgi:hypothetical protein